jgi:uncharacterized protein (UPF0276 family)
VNELINPHLGFGLGLRPAHYEALLGDYRGSVDWLEVLTENYLVPGGQPLRFLERLRPHYAFVMHGVSLSIGSADPLNIAYLHEVKALADRFNVAWISDHLCWTGVDGVNMHDLMPLPYTEEALRHVVERIAKTQEILGQRILIENVSSYLTYAHSEMTEWEFLSEVAHRADCMLLLDINNVYVSAVNHGFDPQEYLLGVPGERVQQFHLAGHSMQRSETRHGPREFLIDTHDAPVAEDVWQLFAYCTELFGQVSTMIERDDQIPELHELLDELNRARAIANAVASKAA